MRPGPHGLRPVRRLTRFRSDSHPTSGLGERAATTDERGDRCRTGGTVDDAVEAAHLSLERLLNGIERFASGSRRPGGSADGARAGPIDSRRPASAGARVASGRSPAPDGVG